ncbi:sensor histidine kinase [Gracilibacillus dipsosauri]|uniref:sensor histidine kinase n=1 Tax=Gracilibacillus dipsosauri TaxID=178340 RepID=UPI00240A44B4
MKKIVHIIQDNNLFIKIFLVMVISIIAVSIFITISSIRMSSNLFMETFSITNTKVLTQIKDRFNTFSYSVVSTSIKVDENGTIKRRLQEETSNDIEKSRSYYQIKTQMERIFAEIDPNEANLIIMSLDNEIFNMNYFNWPVKGTELRNHAITKQTEARPNEIIYQFDQSNLTNNIPMVIVSKALTEHSTGKIYGYQYVSIREKDLRSFYEGYTSEGNNVLLINSSGQIISSNFHQKIGEKEPKLLQTAKNIENQGIEYLNVNIFNEDYLMLAEYLPTLDMYIVNLVDKDKVQSNLVDTNEIILISILIVLIAVFIVFLILRKMTVSISKLVNQISDMARYQFTKPLEETGGYEAKKIANSFNYMLNELHDYVEILLRTQEKQRKAELEALQHQINPHFIYNTLASIKFMIKQGKKETAFNTIDAFISLIQNALGDVDELITVEQELGNLKNYVLINHARYGDRIKVNYLVSPDCLHFQLPKLVIQPFIENAFFHAFTKKKHGYIQILMAQRENSLVCEIVDNGDGINEEKIDRKAIGMKGKRQLFSGIGVRNVHERIQLLYGKNYGVNITSELNKGTKVVITLPIIEELENQK